MTAATALDLGLSRVLHDLQHSHEPEDLSDLDRAELSMVSGELRRIIARVKAVEDSRRRVQLGWADEHETGWGGLAGVTYDQRPETLASPAWAALEALLSGEPSEFPVEAAATLAAGRDNLIHLINRAAQVALSRRPEYDGKQLGGWFYETSQRYQGIH